MTPCALIEAPEPIDYSVHGDDNKSTTNAIPVMTDYTAPSGVVSASSEFIGGARYAWKAVNDDDTKDWRTDFEVLYPVWWQYEFAVAIATNKYTVYRNDLTGNITPRDWRLLASDTGAFTGEEVVLDSQIDIIIATHEHYTFENSTEYQYYRLDITDNAGSTQYTGMTRFKLIEIQNFGDFEGSDNPSTVDAMPTMTGYTTPSGEVSAEFEEASSWPAWKAADDDDASLWFTTNGDIVTWWQYEFAVATPINKYSMISGGGASSSSPTHWRVLGSNTGAFAGEETWLQTVGEEAWPVLADKHWFNFNNGESFLYYRFDITDNLGGSITAIKEIELIRTQGL